MNGVETFVHAQAGLHSRTLSQNQPTDNHKLKLSPMFKRRKYKRMFIAVLFLMAEDSNISKAKPVNR